MGPYGTRQKTSGSSNPIGKIGRITTTGSVTEYSLPITGDTRPLRITPGPDGALWFSEYLGNKIGRITTNGVITEYPTFGAYGITVGSDGALWFCEPFANRVGRITVAGVFVDYPVPTGGPLGSGPVQITAGPDGALWFTETIAGKIGRITVGINTSSLPGGVVSTQYASTTLEAQGGTPPYSWSAIALPPGLMLSVAGVLGGTPTTEGAFNSTISVRDSSAPPQTALKNFNLLVGAVLTITTGSLPNGVFNAQ
jgi:streptogramin lyase